MSKAVPIPQGATLQPLNSATEDPFAGIAKPIDDPYASIAKPITDSNQEPQATGPLHQIGGFLQGAGENIGGAIEGVHNLFRGPQNDEENSVRHKVMVGEHGELGGRLALAGYRFLHGVNDTLNQSDAAGRAGAKEAKESGSAKAGLLTDMENEPFIGNATKLAEHGEYGKALGDLLNYGADDARRRQGRW
jgi:hypothetical protein